MTKQIGQVVIAIPVQNEVQFIGPCLDALAAQHPAPDRITLLLNNCSDGTADCVARLKPRLPVPCEIIERELPRHQANAGHARGLAMRHAAAGLTGRDVLITTDADGRVNDNWLNNTLTAFQKGAEVVCGRAEIDPDDAKLIPRHLHDDDARERDLIALVDEIAAIVDPDPYDPWPRHTENSGASIAVTVDAWWRSGGIPDQPSGEDRAFIDRLRAIDARIRHDPSVSVTVSGRTQGRAEGGMADTIRRRIGQQDEFADASVEPAIGSYRRYLARARLRALWSHPSPDSATAKKLAASLSVSVETLYSALANRYFGQAWHGIEQRARPLQRRRLRFGELAKQITDARDVLAYARETHAAKERTHHRPPAEPDRINA